MIFVTGPLYAGKQSYICNVLRREYDEFSSFGIRDVEKLVSGEEDLPALAEKLSAYEVVIMTETGSGVVPVDEKQRRDREMAGRLGCLLAERAEIVVRVCCGLPQTLKGKTLC